MVSPGTLGGVSMGASAGGSIINALGALQGGESSSRMYNYQSGVALMNRQIALKNADYSIETGERQAQDYGIKASQRAGLIRATQGASGLDVGSGSTVDVRKGQDLAKDIDLGTIRTNAARIAFGFQTEAAGDLAKSEAYKMAASDSKKAGMTKALGSLIGGAASVSDKWLQMGQYGLNSKAGGGSELDPGAA